MTSTQVFDRAKLLKLAVWARLSPHKQAFVDPTAMGGMPPGGAPPMAPMMAGPMPGGPPPMPPGAPPMDPAAMGGMPDPMMAAPPDAALSPPDSSTQAMGDQEMIRSIIREEIQKAIGSGEGGVAASGKKSGNKFEDALSVLEDKVKELTKIFVTALHKAGVDISLADQYGIDMADGSGAATGTPTAAQKGVSETLQTGLGGDVSGSQPGKIASVGDKDQIEQLVKLAAAKDHLQRSALAPQLLSFDPQKEDLSYLAGLFR